MKCPCGKTHGPPKPEKRRPNMQQLQEDAGRIPDQFTRERAGTWPQIATDGWAVTAGPGASFEWSAGSPEMQVENAEMTLENGMRYPARLRLDVDVPAEFQVDDQPVIRARPGWLDPVQTYGTAIHEEFERFGRGSRGRS